MEAFLVLKDTLDVQVLSTLIPVCKEQTADRVSCGREFSQVNMALCHDYIWITLIICATIFLLTLSVVGMILYYKSKRTSDKLNGNNERKSSESLREDQIAIEIEKEKKLYRERLLNYLELHGKEGEYITELKSLINGVSQ